MMNLKILVLPDKGKRMKPKSKTAAASVPENGPRNRVQNAAVHVRKTDAVPNAEKRTKDLVRNAARSINPYQIT